MFLFFDDLFFVQKRPILETKETCLRDERDLFTLLCVVLVLRTTAFVNAQTKHVLLKKKKTQHGSVNRSLSFL